MSTPGSGPGRGRQSTLGGYFGAQRPASARNKDGMTPCHKCQRVFECKQGLATHMRHNHEFGRPATHGPKHGKAKVVKNSAKATGLFNKGVRVADGVAAPTGAVGNPAPQPQPQPAPLDAAADDKRSRRQRNLTNAECILICNKADYYMSAQATADGVKPGEHWANTAAAAWARKEFNRNPFTRKQAKTIHGLRHKYEKAKGTKAKIKRTPALNSQGRLGAYPDVESSLALWIRQLRAIGFPCETFVVDLEAKGWRSSRRCALTTATMPASQSSSSLRIGARPFSIATVSRCGWSQRRAPRRECQARSTQSSQRFTNRCAPCR